MTWLNRIFENASRQVAAWPAWMRDPRVRGLPTKDDDMTDMKNGDPAQFDRDVQERVLKTYTPQELVALARSYPTQHVPRALVLELFERVLPAPVSEGKERADGKFQGRIYKNKNGEEVPPDEYVVFLVKDNAFLPTLRFYREECQRQGAASAQLQAVDEAIARVEAWRAVNTDRCKTPDVEPGEIKTK